jgi:hypothetical protein
MNDRLIFISYSRKDKTWKDLLEEQLGVLEQQGLLETWTDADIGAGEDWYEKIDQAMKKASVAILIVSAASLNSTFIQKKEVRDLLQRRFDEKLPIVPILIKDCLWKNVEWLAKMGIRPRDGRPLQEKSPSQKTRELTLIAAEIAQIVGAAKTPDREVKPAKIGRQDIAARPETEAIEKEMRDLEVDRARIEKRLAELTSRTKPTGGTTSEQLGGTPRDARKGTNRSASDAGGEFKT